jgi:hypothetical protein
MFVHKRIISSIMRVEFIGDRMSYKILGGCLCDIILNVCVQTEGKGDDPEDIFLV